MNLSSHNSLVFFIWSIADDDLLGVHYQDIASKFSRDNRRVFYTPPAISEMMANICIYTDKIIAEGKPVTIREPSA